MSLAEFRQVSPVVVDLIKSMLSTDPAQRPTTAQVLRNSWIVGGTCLPLSVHKHEQFVLGAGPFARKAPKNCWGAGGACLPLSSHKEQFVLVVTYSHHSNRK
jgi:hypothetical protein